MKKVTSCDIKHLKTIIKTKMTIQKFCEHESKDWTELQIAIENGRAQLKTIERIFKKERGLK